MTATPADTAQIAEQLVCCSEDLDATDQRVQLALFRHLAQGEPVAPSVLAGALGLDDLDMLARLGRWHGVHTDDAGHIVAFQGLSIVEAPHRLRVGGRTLYAWCAWDTLFLPELIGRPAEIESTCPATGNAIALRVGPEGPAVTSPPGTVLSFVLPGSRFGDDTIASFCNLIRYFSSSQAAEEWTTERPGTFVLSIEQGFEIGRRTNAAQLGAALHQT
ncbi:MAG: organomercurial lyase [Solirubrobacterales bacterium]